MCVEWSGDGDIARVCLRWGIEWPACRQGKLVSMEDLGEHGTVSRERLEGLGRGYRPIVAQARNRACSHMRT